MTAGDDTRPASLTLMGAMPLVRPAAVDKRGRRWKTRSGVVFHWRVRCEHWWCEICGVYGNRFNSQIS
jgi:hypothetical protein